VAGRLVGKQKRWPDNVYVDTVAVTFRFDGERVDLVHRSFGQPRTVRSALARVRPSFHVHGVRRTDHERAVVVNVHRMRPCRNRLRVSVSKGNATTTPHFTRTFFGRRITDFVRPVGLGRDVRLGSTAGRIGHHARDHALSVLGHGSRIHDEVGRRSQEHPFEEYEKNTRLIVIIVSA